jgi:NADH:ubiquinone oxidoreductase subunit 5 (subunit L)/multisubunit Na+/H+ antiporter MnhA subunit
VIVLIGLTSGWYVFGRKEAVDTEAVKQRLGWVYSALANKLYFDTVYSKLLIRPYMALTEVLARFDGRVIDGIVNGAASAFKATASGSWTFDIKAIDGTVNGIAAFIKESGARARRIQVGRVQSYQRYMFAGIVLFFVLTFAILLKGA